MNKNLGSNLQVRLPEDSFDDDANDFNKDAEDDEWNKNDEDLEEFKQHNANNGSGLMKPNDPGRPAGPPTLPQQY